MPAESALQLQNQIQLLIKAADKAIELFDVFTAASEENELLAQSPAFKWDDLPTHALAPEFYKDENGVPIPSPDGTTQIRFGSVLQPFNADDLLKVKNHIDQLLQALNGQTMAGGNVNRGRNFRKLAAKTGAE
jgi:hypothetical protein